MADQPGASREGQDPVLDRLIRAPFHVHRPGAVRVPFVFSSPHSGRAYPAGFVAQSRLSFDALRRSEDAFVDELFASVLDDGAPLIAAAFPRAYCDVNRAPSEFDAGMFEGPLPFPVDAASPRVHAGLGVIPRVVREGAEIYRRKLAASDAAERMAHLYRPYHGALDDLAREAEAQFGVAVVVDCHSMPSASAAPDIVLGDRYGVSASPLLIRAAETAFLRQGFSVARNVPYAGGYTTQLHGRPGRGRHALQIEINRTLYLDEETIRPTQGYRMLQQRLAASLRALLAFDPAALRRWPHAAE